MPTKKNLKRSTTNIFERRTGHKIHKMIGGSDCHVTDFPRILYRKKQYMTRAVAASLYHNIPLSEVERVTSTCGVKNCVNPDHLVLPSTSSKPDAKFENKARNRRLKNNDPDAPDEMGEIHGCSPELWDRLNDYQKGLARKGYSNPATLMYEKE